MAQERLSFVCILAKLLLNLLMKFMAAKVSKNTASAEKHAAKAKKFALSVEAASMISEKAMAVDNAENWEERSAAASEFYKAIKAEVIATEPEAKRAKKLSLETEWSAAMDQVGEDDDYMKATMVTLASRAKWGTIKVKFDDAAKATRHSAKAVKHAAKAKYWLGWMRLWNADLVPSVNMAASELAVEKAHAAAASAAESLHSVATAQ